MKSLCEECSLNSCNDDRCKAGNNPETLHRSIEAWRERHGQQLERAETAEAEVERLRTALEDIRDYGSPPASTRAKTALEEGRRGLSLSSLDPSETGRNTERPAQEADGMNEYAHLCILCRKPDTRGLGLCQKCVSDAALGRAVKKMPKHRWIQRDASDWIYGSPDRHWHSETLEAALRAAGLMEEEK